MQTAAMFTDAGMTRSQTRTVAKHLKVHFGASVVAPEYKWMELGDKFLILRRYGEYKYTYINKKKGKDKGKKTSKTAQYWVSNLFAATRSVLAWRTRQGKLIRGFKFPAMDKRALPVSFMGDHGNVAFRVCIIIISDEDDRQGESVQVAHLMSKEEREILVNTIAPDLDAGIRKLQQYAVAIVEVDGKSHIVTIPSTGSGWGGNRSLILPLLPAPRTTFPACKMVKEKRLKNIKRNAYETKVFDTFIGISNNPAKPVSRAEPLEFDSTLLIPSVGDDEPVAGKANDQQEERTDDEGQSEGGDVDADADADNNDDETENTTNNQDCADEDQDRIANLAKMKKYATDKTALLGLRPKGGRAIGGHPKAMTQTASDEHANGNK